MKIVIRASRAAIILAALIMVLDRPAMAIPQAIGISGYITDADGQSLNGTRLDYAVEYYDAETSGTRLGDQRYEGVVDVESGLFSIVLQPPLELLLLDEVWYRLAIETNRPENAEEGYDWLDDGDWFYGRFQLLSVPFAMSGPPVPFFVTIPTESAESPVPTGWENHVAVAPFCTPPGPVRFNKMSVTLRCADESSDRCSFGIYDEEGELVVESGLLTLPAGFGGFVEVEVEGRLRPSRLYYTAIGRGHYVVIKRSLLTPVPGTGYLPNAATAQQIPATINPAAIAPYSGGGTIGITLRDDRHHHDLELAGTQTILSSTGKKVRLIPLEAAPPVKVTEQDDADQ